MKRLLPTRAELADFVVLAGLGALAMYSFKSSYGGHRYLVLGVSFWLVGSFIGYLTVKLRLHLVIGAAIAVLTYVTIGSAVALPDRAPGGLVPTPASMAAAARTVVAGWKELITTAPPVGDAGDLLALPVLLGVVGGFSAYLLARRTRVQLLALVPPMIVLGLGIVTGTNVPVSTVLHGVVFSAAAIAWMSYKEHDRRPLLEGSTATGHRLAGASAMLALGAAGGFFAAPHLPLNSGETRTIWRQTITPPFDPREYPSPLAGYRRYVKEAATKDLEMFTIEGLPKGVLVRMATMDSYDGLVWSVTAGDPDRPSLNDSGSFERVGAEVPAEFPGDRAVVTVTIGNYNDVWVPSVGEVLSLRFAGSTGGADRDRQLNESLRYNRGTDTAANRLQLQEGDRYSMTVVLPPQLDKLAGHPIAPDARVGPLQGVTAVTAAFSADTALLKMSDEGARLDRIRDIMRSDGAYSDGEAGMLPSRAGHSAYRLEEFLGQYSTGAPMVGNAEQYASAFAVLFRDMFQVPTRVVMGFKPEAASTEQPIAVLAREVEAWVEVPIRDLGWVAIAPTPDRQQTSPAKAAMNDPLPEYRTQTPPPPPMLDPEFEQSATAKGEARTAKKPEAPKPAQAPPTKGWFTGAVAIVASGVGVPVGLILLGCVLVVVAKYLRRRRRRRRGSPHQRIANGWREVTDLAVDQGHPLPESITRQEAAAFVGHSAPRLAADADHAVWAGGEPTEDEVARFWRSLNTTLKEIRRDRGVGGRLRTAVSSQSLRAARRRRKHHRQVRKLDQRTARRTRQREAAIAQAGRRRRMRRQEAEK